MHVWNIPCQICYFLKLPLMSMTTCVEKMWWESMMKRVNKSILIVINLEASVVKIAWLKVSIVPISLTYTMTQSKISKRQEQRRHCYLCVLILSYSTVGQQQESSLRRISLYHNLVFTTFWIKLGNHLSYLVHVLTSTYFF